MQRRAAIFFPILLVIIALISGQQQDISTDEPQSTTPTTVIPSSPSTNISEHDEATAERLRKIEAVTKLLDRILEKYDSKARPVNADGSPTKVMIEINVRSMGPVSEMDGSYALDCYFRQAWLDERLAFFNGTQSTLSLGMSTLDKIWKPDTYFWNGKGSYLHKLTQPNRLVRLQAEGKVLYSSRLTVIAVCAMNLKNFPLDTQECPLIIGSFAYRAGDIVYQWQNGPNKSVEIDKGSKMSQFRVGTSMSMSSLTSFRDGEYSSLQVKFVLTRRAGFYILNFYLPCTLVVLLSWVSFWINREATGDRVSLGVTAILTMTFLSQDSRSDVPRVSYPTALDVYILICFTFLFLSILEFTFVHIYTKFGTGDPELVAILLEHERESNKKNKVRSALQDMLLSKQVVAAGKCFTNPEFNKHWSHSCGQSGLLVARKGPPNTRQPLTWRHRLRHYWHKMAPPNHQDQRATEMDPSKVTNSISRIDRLSRFLFPTSFIFIVGVYWHTYVYVPALTQVRATHG